MIAPTHQDKVKGNSLHCYKTTEKEAMYILSEGGDIDQVDILIKSPMPVAAERTSHKTKQFFFNVNWTIFTNLHEEMFWSFLYVANKCS